MIIAANVTETLWVAAGAAITALIAAALWLWTAREVRDTRQETPSDQ